MSELKNTRRYYHRERMNALARGEEELAAAWRAKQEGQPGVALPAEFPYIHELAAAGYTTLEDLAGADLHELQRIGKFVRREAQTILDEYAVLIAP